MSTKYEIELKKALDYHGAESGLNPTTKQVANHYFAPNNFVKGMVDFIRSNAADDLKLPDDQLLKLIGFSEDEKSRFRPGVKEGLVKALRQALEKTSLTYSVKDFKTALKGILGGMQIAFHEYGKDACPKGFGFLKGWDHAAMYLPNNTFFERIGSSTRNPANLQEWIIVGSNLLETLQILDAMRPFYKEGVPNAKYSAAEFAVAAGFEESFHAYQHNNKRKEDALIEAMAKQSGHQIDFAAPQTAATSHAIHANDVWEADAEQAKIRHDASIRNMAKAISSIGRA